MEGVCRVYCPCEETEGMTLAFCSQEIVCERIASAVTVLAEALTSLKFRRDVVNADELGMDAVNE